MTARSFTSAPWIPLTPSAADDVEGMAEVLLYPAQTHLARAQSASASDSSTDSALLKHRISELRALGLEAFCSAGPKSIQSWQVLGVGYCGLVLRVRWQGQVKALKLRRWDASRATLRPEAEALQLANTVQVGPRYQAVSPNALVMDEVKGDHLMDWVRYTLPCQQPHPSEVHTALKNLAEAAFRLDQLGLDHGELNCVASHAIVQGQQATLIDFSQASRDRRVSNVTALVQGLLVGTSIPELLGRYFELPARSQTIERLRAYKQQPSRDRFEAVRSLLELPPSLGSPVG